MGVRHQAFGLEFAVAVNFRLLVVFCFLGVLAVGAQF